MWLWWTFFTALLFKQGKDIRLKEGDESKNKEHYNQMKMQMLQSWLPLLCRASNGTDAPVLSSTERAELERVLEGTIEMLEEEDQQEKVLTLWLHHFTHCSASDWPNLHASYARWCSAARNKLLLNHCWSSCTFVWIQLLLSFLLELCVARCLVVLNMIWLSIYHW